MTDIRVSYFPHGVVDGRECREIYAYAYAAGSRIDALVYREGDEARVRRVESGVGGVEVRAEVVTPGEPPRFTLAPAEAAATAPVAPNAALTGFAAALAASLDTSPADAPPSATREATDR